MALTYEKVIGVISHPPDKRKDFEVNNLLSWFRKKSDLFRNLKTELLFDIIKHLQLETKKRDEVIIRQGEKGDCMYILLRGQVTIYILYAAKTDNEDDKPAPPPPAPKAGESIRTQLGTFVCNLGAGATFGEVALISDDCIRTASIIADDFADLIVVDRELYDRSVKSVLQKEFQDKSNFIASSPFFSNWPPKYKKQLAMALVKDSIPYENFLTKQGDPVNGIYFILSGEVKLLTDAGQHENQYPRLGPLERERPPPAEEANEVNQLLKKMSMKKALDDDYVLPKYRRRSTRKNVLELCLLGVNECVGDIEVLMDMETSMQTAVCTQRTEVLILEMKHYERLLVKRNPRTIDLMKKSLELKITSRISSHIARQVPLLKCLSTKILEYLEQKAQVTVARAKAKENKNNKPPPRKLADSYNAFIPVKGPLVDQYGPGTVFHRIRQRQKAKAKQNAASRYSKGGSATGNALQGSSSVLRASSAGAKMEDAKPAATRDLLPDQIDPVLDSLEKRMRDWLVNEKGTGKNMMLKSKWQVYSMKKEVREAPSSKTSCSSQSGSFRPHWPSYHRGSKVPIQSPQLRSGRKSAQDSERSTTRMSTGGVSSNHTEESTIGEKETIEIYNGNAFV